MDQLKETYRGTGGLHHAYVIEGDRDAAFAELVDFIERELGLPTRANPDFWHADYETFGIDDGRMLAALQLRRPVAGGRKLFVVKAYFMTHEAQNSLLKVFEEPTEGTHFFVIMPSAERLLPTLLSRVSVVSGARGGTEGVMDAAREFHRGSPKARSELLKAFIDEKDKSGAVAFVNALESVVRRSFDLAKASEAEVFALAEIEKGRRFLEGPSPSVKLVLEHIAGVLPRAK